MRELELKWIKLLQKHHPLGFKYNNYHEGNISRLSDFDVLFDHILNKFNVGLSPTPKVHPTDSDPGLQTKIPFDMFHIYCYSACMQ